MTTCFYNMIRFPVKFPKKNVKFPKDWQKIKTSTYKNEPNFAILTGKINDIVVIDLDIKGSDKSIKWFEAGFGPINCINTMYTKSVNGGYHFFYKYNENVKNKTLKSVNVDILSDNRCCFGGEGYPVMNMNDLVETEMLIKELTLEQIQYINSESKEETINNKEKNSKDKEKSKEKNTNTKEKNCKNKTEHLFTKKELEEILGGLSMTRADTREHWIKVGYILSKYPFGKELFENFSKRSQLFDPERHDIDWLSVQTDNPQVTVGTLIYWLKTDNPELYNKLIKKDKKILSELDSVAKSVEYNVNHTELVKKTKTHLQVSFSNIDNTLLNIHNLNSDCKEPSLYSDCSRTSLKFRCFNCNFEYPTNEIQIKRELAPTVYQTLVINEDVSNKETLKVAMRIRDEVKLLYNNKMWFSYDTETGIYVRRDRLEIINTVDSVVQNLRDIGENNDWFGWTDKIAYKKSLLEELEAKCFSKDILDEHAHLLGFPNGVYDLSTGIFRRGDIDEFVSMVCKYPYSDEYNTELAEKFLKDIFPVDEEYVYALCKFALVLEGMNREQSITFNYGFTASNGKSFLMERINNLLGDYSNTFPVNLLTSKMKAAGEANSTLIEFKNKRFMYCSEPEAKAKLNTNFTKMLTGDVIKARGLYSVDDECIKPTYDIFVCCNALPAFDTYDEGISRRIKMLEFKTKFCEHPKKKNEKLVKRYTPAEITTIEQGLLLLFINKYNELRIGDFKYSEPNLLSELKKLYINDSKDEISNIIKQVYTIGNKEDYIKMKDIKELLRARGLEKDSVSVKYIIQDIFDFVEYRDRLKQSNNVIRSVFLYLKLL